MFSSPWYSCVFVSMCVSSMCLSICVFNIRLSCQVLMLPIDFTENDSNFSENVINYDLLR